MILFMILVASAIAETFVYFHRSRSAQHQQQTQVQPSAWGVTFNLQKNKKKPVVEEKEDIKQPEEEETIIDATPETTEEPDQIEEIVEINEEKPIIPTESADEPVVASSQAPQILGGS